MKEIDVNSISTKELYKYLTSSITPRPIALVSSIDKDGNSNLSPFSFFNLFSIKPPILIFSPLNRVRDNTKKDTLNNISQVKECVIALVNKNIAQQVSLASTSYSPEEDEFEKAGFNKVKAKCIHPYLVKESPVNFECKVNSIVELGNEGGSGNLVICEVLKIHINNNVLDDQDNIDPLKLDIISRLGSNWYGKTNQSSLYEITRPISRIGIGIDNLPEDILTSNILSGSDLAILASIEAIPNKKNNNTTPLKREEKHILAKKLLKEGKIDEAWKILI
jgi:flavin reductase (DIM6/NTAB) family NADH-FMN oxidoreductase RutF|tara:strand:+ start:1591 stop:2424 length:834 start_codon:yes stop_codon:yes gene_type:complete